MSPRLGVALAVAIGLALATAWAYEIPLERALVLAPAVVLGVGLVAAVGVLLTRAAIESIRDSGHPRLVVAAIAGLTALAVVLTILGVELPRE
jgi:predicted acyltransferase